MTIKTDNKIVMRKVSTLKPAPYNPRVELTPAHKEYQEIQKSVEAFGVVQPLIFSTKRKYIIGGAQRLTVLRDLGIESVPTIGLTIPSLEEEKALNLALNKISGLWDPDKLAALKEEGIFGLDFPTGFSLAEVEAIGRQSSLPAVPRASVPVNPDDPQLYQIVIECDDAEHQQEILSQIQGMGLTARGVII